MDRAADDGSQQDARDALALYEMSLDIFENYIKNPVPAAGSDVRPASDAILGRGTPQVSSDVVYAANELRELLERGGTVVSLLESADLPQEDDHLPSVDLTNSLLYTKSWERVNFSWLNTNYSASIDLRGANLTESRWGASNLSGAHLQCANLTDAGLYDATLVGADFRGANLDGTDLRNADLERC